MPNKRDHPSGAVSPVNGQKLPRGKPFTSESAREARQKRTAKEQAQASIAEEFRKLVREYQTMEKGETATGAEIIAASILEACTRGNVKAQELALALMGEKPAERVMISTPDLDTVERVENALFGGGDT